MIVSVTLPEAVITLLTVACTTLLVVGFRYALSRSPLPSRLQRSSVANLVSIICLWFIVAGTLAGQGFFSNFNVLPPRLLFAVLLPGVALLLASFKSRTLAVTLQHTPVAWLIYLQVFRVIVEVVLWQGYRTGVVPVQMTFEGRNFDIAAGLTAPIAGWMWQRTKNRLVLILWNGAGLLLLLNIVVVAILSMPTPLRLFANGPANTLLATFPFIYLAAALVTIAYTAHILSMKQLLSYRAA